jgi:hypothetical protein
LVRSIVTRSMHRFQSARRYSLLLLLAFVAVLSASSAHGQTTGTLNGTVTDTEGGAIPAAKVTVTSAKSKANRSTVTNGVGYFTVNALQADTYNVMVVAKGFQTLTIAGVEIDPGDSRTIQKIELKPGTVEMQVTVSALVAGVSLDSPEKSSLITADDIKRLSTVGRDATELLKMLPGFAVSPGGSLANGTTSNTMQTMGFNSGVNSFSANGATPQTGAVTVISDGASVMDPGDMGASISSVNMDMVAEVKVSTSNFGADSAKGPVIIQAVGISGGTTYHGTAYFIARNGALNANDWLNNFNSVTRPNSSYYYPGGNITGPVKIPGTHFNSSKKLTFALGFEYYKQNVFNQLITSFIPTARMLTGDLTPASIASALNIDPSVLTAACPTFYTSNGTAQATSTNPGGAVQGTQYQLTNSSGFCYSPGLSDTAYDTSGAMVHSGNDAGQANGLLPVDPRALIYAGFWPKANRAPGPAFGQASNGYNYVDAITSSQNGYQLHGRIDENFTENTKLYVTYQLEKINAELPIQNGYYAGSDIIPYPTPAFTNTKSNLLSLNFTHVFSPTLTNEFVPAGTYFYQPVQLSNLSKVLDANTGWTGGRYFNNGIDQLPGIVDYENGVPDFAMTTLTGKGQYFRKFSYDAADNLTKQIRSHSIKVGAYFEETGNNQVPYNYGQGLNSYNHYNSGCTTSDGTGNVTNLHNNIANFLQGCTGFSQYSGVPSVDLHFKTIDFYGTDEWKATKKLTFTLGVRFDHLGPWTDPHGVGLAVWTPPSQHVNVTGITQDPRTYPGISWHAVNTAIPNSGQMSKLFFYAPRVGVAYDLYGTGTTVFRGGWGEYTFHDSYNDSAGPAGTVQGVQQYTGPVNLSCTYAQITASSPSFNKTPSGPCNQAQSGNINPFVIYALDPSDKEQPVTYNYNFTMSQVFIKHTFLEISYVGNRSAHTFTEGNLSNQNVIPLGGLFQPDPLTGAVTQPGSTQQVVQDYRPYPYYSQVYVPHHIGYSNYNGLQVSWTKNKGPLNFNINYTWSKALGIHGDYRSGAVGDPTNLRNNYGYLGFNRPQALNFTYSYQVGNSYHGNRLVRGIVNQWLISGITNIQSGADTVVNNGTSNTNFGLGGGVSYTPAGTTTATAISLSNYVILGTPDINLQPVVTCNPKSGLKNSAIYGRNYINGACFALPKLGQNGQFELPDISGPAYISSDLTVQRSVPLKGQKNLQFRVAAFNFLNHPLPQFYGGNQVGLNLGFGLPTGATAAAYTTPQAAIAAAVNTTPNFGYTPYKGGYRVMEFQARFNF